MKFHIGMPTHDDWDGVYMTVTDLMTHHMEHIGAISVIDNAPEVAECAIKLQEFCKSCGVNYVSLPFPKGPCGAKDKVFRVSPLPTVCIDSHVHLAKGALAALAAAWEEGPAIYQGPLLNVDGTIHATHLKDIYGTDGMRGTWSTGFWDGENAYDAPGISIIDGKPGIYGAPKCKMHEAPVKSMPLGAHGCGLIACDPKHWPGFNPAMRGFGGEEWYIQDKMRKRGGKVLFVPGLGWKHRWACQRPGKGATHTPILWDKIRNQVIGAIELGLDLRRVRDAFPQCPQDEWMQIVNGAERKIVACGSCKKVGSAFKTPVEWHASNVTDDRFTYSKGEIIDVGNHFDVSIPAVLASNPSANLLVIHPAAPAVCARFGVRWELGTSLTTEPRPCDTLILGDIGSQYTRAAELRRWLPLVRQRAIIACNMMDGTLQQVTQYVRQNRDWTVFKNGKGFLVLTRDDADKMRPPTIVSPGSIYRFAKALGKHLADGAKKVPLDVYESRLAECDVCPARNDSRCGHCGCVLDLKAAMPKEKCPIDIWGSYVE